MALWSEPGRGASCPCTSRASPCLGPQVVQSRATCWALQGGVRASSSSRCLCPTSTRDCDLVSSNCRTNYESHPSPASAAIDPHPLGTRLLHCGQGQCQSSDLILQALCDVTYVTDNNEQDPWHKMVVMVAQPCDYSKNH